MTNTQLHIIAVQPYGYIDGPYDQGLGAQGSRARIREALVLAEALACTCRVIFLFPQGYKKEHPSMPGDRPVSLGESMARYVKSKLHEGDERIRVHALPLSWGTIDDVKSIPRMLKDIGEDDKEPHVHFVTDPTHLKRVKLVWKYVHPEGWKGYFHPAKQHRMRWKERWIREPIARFRYLLQLVV